MSMCDLCYAPGQCCKNIQLSITFWDDSPMPQQWEERKKECPGNENAPFIPVRKLEPSGVTADGRAYSRWEFSCPVLLPNGRCGDYENRPDICRIFEPGSDRLCVHYRGAENSELTDLNF